MGFTASLWGNTVGFGVGTGEERRRILYDGPYQPPPYSISVSAAERDPNSDDEFTEGTINLGIDLSTLEGSASTTISQIPGDKDDTDVGDEPDDPDDPDETASYAITCSGEVTPAVEIAGSDHDGVGPIDFRSRSVAFSVMPKNAPGTVNIILHGDGGQTVELLTDEPVSGGDNIVKTFQWDVFSEIDERFRAHSLEVQFNAGNASAAKPSPRAKSVKTGDAIFLVNDVRAVKGIAFGQFTITRFVTPDDAQWDGPTEIATLNGKPLTVHTGWVDRVRGSEGKGLTTTKDIVKIRGPGGFVKNQTGKGKHFEHPPGTQNLFIEDEGRWAKRLAVDHSLAKHEEDDRFNGHDQILLSTDPGKTFFIEDTGNWETDPPGPHNHFDRYAGLVGPGDPDINFPSAYVVKLPKK